MSLSKFDSLSYTFPVLVGEWDYARNETTPDSVRPSSSLQVWWICPINPCGCHRWMTTIRARAFDKTGCPFCAKHKVCDHTSLLAMHPDLCKEWDCEKNSVDPNTILPGTKQIVWWVCQKNPCGCHKWQASVTSRSRLVNTANCPFCSNQRVCKHTSLLAKYPDLCKEWDYERNEITPDEITNGSSYMAWWKCQVSACDCHVWQTRVSHRTNSGDSGCPFCLNRRVCVHNSLLWMRPELCSEWFYTKNDNLPIEYSVHARAKVWWRCSMFAHHVWKAAINQRTKKNGTGCPRCKDSRGERLVVEILTALDVRYVPQYRFDDCVYLYKLPLDFYLIDNNTVIEFDGAQHFQPLDCYGGLEEYTTRRIKDNIRNKYCWDNGINLLRISHRQTDVMESIIGDFLERIQIGSVSISFSDAELYEDMSIELEKHKLAKMGIPVD